MPAKFTLFKASNSQFYFNLKSGNNEKVFQSEGYIFKSSCESGISSVKQNAPYDSRYEKKKASNGQYYFVLKALNGQIICTSEIYLTEQSRDNGINVVKSIAPSAPTEDLT